MPYHIVKLPDDEPWRVWKLYPDTAILHYGEALDIFLLLGEEKALLIDTAYGRGEFPNLVASLLDGRELMVVNTHGHYDHTGGNPWFPRVYMHPDAALIADRAFGPVDEAWLANMPHRDYEKVPIGDGHVFDLGGRKVEVLHTPAHNSGSLSFIDHGRRLLFSGDEFDAGQANLGDISSVRAFLANMERLWSREGEYDWVMPNHNGCPVDKGYIPDFITAARNVCEGKPDLVSREGLPAYKRGFGPCVRVRVGLSAINYRPD
ncbi:MAG: MBL fold metallo-hydrolase [Christensenellales bacterium]|jgi:hydroxyacylglutathione hydrolase